MTARRQDVEDGYLPVLVPSGLYGEDAHDDFRGDAVAGLGRLRPPGASPCKPGPGGGLRRHEFLIDIPDSLPR